MLPFLNVKAKTFPEAYHQMLNGLYEKGSWNLKGSYVPGKKVDRILEVEGRISISNSFKEPMVSRAIPGIHELPNYVEAILLGTRDYLIGKQYTYTYHERIFPPWLGPGGQLEPIIKRLGGNPYTNQAQLTTWIPEKDSKSDAPPCLQRMWFKIYGERLFMYTSWRSREALYAWPENVIAMFGVGLLVLNCLNDYYNYSLKDLWYVDHSNSLHIYEKDRRDFERTVKTIKKRPSNAWDSSDPRLLQLWECNLFDAVKKTKEEIFDPIFK